MSKFVFISYKSDDRELIQPYLELLKNNGVTYWWDQEIARDWGREIDQKLDECSAVVGFMTEASLGSDAVYAEFESGKASGKLVPVRLDPSRPPYHFRTVLGSLTYIDLASESPDQADQEKKKLISKLAEALGIEGTSGFIDNTPGTPDMEQWFSGKDRQSQIAYIVALCVFEGYSHDFIQSCAAQLDQELVEAGLNEMLSLNRKLVTRQDKLKSIGARITPYRSKVTGSTFESVTFNDGNFGKEAFLYAWNELDQLKYPVIRWINRLIDTRPADCVEDIAVMLSLIGRQNFQSIYRLILRPWLGQAWTWRFRCADIALSFLMDDPGIKKLISQELLQVEMEQLDGGVAPTTPTEGTEAAAPEVPEFAQQLPRESAIALVTGYTGMRMPDLSIALFKRIDNQFSSDTASHKGSTLHNINKGIDELLVRAKNDPYARALPLSFANGIHGWINGNGGNRKTVLPEYIFLRLLEKLTLSGETPHRAYIATLEDIVADGGEVSDSAIDVFSKTIASALECGNTFIRDGYTRWMKEWKKQVKEREKDDRDAAGNERDRRMFIEIFDAAKEHASTDNDVERIAHHTKLN